MAAGCDRNGVLNPQARRTPAVTVASGGYPGWVNGPRGWVAICAVAAATLAGCSGGDGPAPTVLSSISPRSSSSTPVSSAPTALTPQGAAAFARYFFTVLDTAYNTGDTTTLESISAPECVACRRYISSIRQVYDDGGRFEGGSTTVRFAEAPRLSTSTQAEVDAVFDISAIRALANDGSEIFNEDAIPGRRVTIQLSRREGSWRVQEVERVE